MSERGRESTIASLLASKRLVVSLCAAIAMVLGAMSAGASVFTSASTAEPQQTNSVFNEAPRSSSIASTSNEVPLFKRRPTLASQSIVAQSPLYTSIDTSQTKDKKGLNLKLKQDVVKAPSAALFYDPTTPPEQATPVSPAVQQEPAPTDNEEPLSEPGDSTTEPPASDTTPSTDPAPPPSDPTTEPAMNNVPAPTPEQEQQQLKN